MSVRYQDLNIKPYLKAAVADLHFETLTQIQEEVMPLALKGKDIIGQSQTGSGKTHAFLIPIFEGLDEDLQQVQAVITTPTRELDEQIYNVDMQLASFCDQPIKIARYVGGTDKQKTIEKLGTQPQIVIGTPGRIKDLALALKGKDIIGQSQTGSGKTHAFLIPIFEGLDEDLQQVQAVITTPTRELAEQIYNVAMQLASFCDKPIKIGRYVGGTDKQKTIEKLGTQPQIVIGTPGRIKDLAINERVLLAHTAKMFVVDEADMTLETGFLTDIDQIAGTMGRDLQMMVFSATIPQALKPFLKKYMTAPTHIHIQPRQQTAVKIEHILYPTKLIQSNMPQKCQML